MTYRMKMLHDDKCFQKFYDEYRKEYVTALEQPGNKEQRSVIIHAHELLADRIVGQYTISDVR